MDTSPKAMVFLAMIVLAFIFLISTGPLFFPKFLTMFMVQLFGLLLIFWSLLAKKVNKHATKKELPKGYFFVDKGPYEIIRHPIYAGLLMIGSALVQYDFTLIRAWAFLILALAIIANSIREESVMVELVTDYKKYKKRVKRIIPYVF